VLSAPRTFLLSPPLQQQIPPVLRPWLLWLLHLLLVPLMLQVQLVMAV